LGNKKSGFKGSRIEGLRSKDYVVSGFECGVLGSGY